MKDWLNLSNGHKIVLLVFSVKSWQIWGNRKAVFAGKIRYPSCVQLKLLYFGWVQMLNWTSKFFLQRLKGLAGFEKHIKKVEIERLLRPQEKFMQSWLMSANFSNLPWGCCRCYQKIDQNVSIPIQLTETWHTRVFWVDFWDVFSDCCFGEWGEVSPNIRSNSCKFVCRRNLPD